MLCFVFQNLLVNANPNQPIVVQTDRNQNLPANQLPASQIVASNLQNLISVPQSSVSSSNTVNSTLPSSTLSSSTPPVLASVSSSRTDLPGCSTSTLSTSNPINDPHISSSVQAVGSDDSSAPAPPVQENIQPEERAAGPSLPTSLTSSEINIVQNEKYAVDILAVSLVVFTGFRYEPVCDRLIRAKFVDLESGAFALLKCLNRRA